MNITDLVNASQEFLAQGHKFKQSGNLEQGIVSYLRAIELNSSCDEAYHFLGEIFAQKDELVKATQAYNQAISINPDNHWSYHCLGQVQSWLGNIHEAIAAARRSIELQPEQPEFLAQLALYLEIKGNTSEAIAYYQQALEIKPDLPESNYSSLIKLMRSCAQLESIIPYCQNGVKFHPYCAELHLIHGEILASLERWQNAIASYNQAVDIRPSYWEAYEALAAAYLKLDRESKATEAEQNAETAFFQHPEFDRAELPADFDWKIYLAFNSELNVTSRLQAIAHFLLYGSKENKLYALKHLHDPQKKPDIAPKSIIETVNRGIVANSTRANRLAVLVHLYYSDLWSELSSYIKNISGEFDLFVNIVASIWQPQMHDIIRQDFPQAKIVISANQGKDIGGHLSSMAHLDFSQYNLMCLLHTKKSPHIDRRISDAWRKDLYDALLGSPGKAAENIATMNQYPHIGSIGSRFWRCTMMGNNWNNYNRLLQEFNIKPEAQDCEYISGTMMFVRGSIMETIYNHFRNVELENGDAQDLSFHVDGQVAHAIERLIGNIVRDHGLEMFWQE